jgi:hypothetical protein
VIINPRTKIRKYDKETLSLYAVRSYLMDDICRSDMVCSILPFFLLFYNSLCERLPADLFTVGGCLKLKQKSSYLFLFLSFIDFWELREGANR